MRTLPMYTLVLALFKFFMCTPEAHHHEWFCLPWQIVVLPMSIYTVYFLISLVKAVKIANSIKHLGEHIDIEVG